jgi:Tol biopolymer transport system component
VRLADRKVANLTRSTKPWLGNVTPAYSPNGKLIAFARSTDAFNSDIFLMTAGGRIVERLTHSEEHGPAWSPDGRTLVYVSNRSGTSWDLYAIRVDGTGERPLTSTPHVDEDAPRFSRDGTRILFVRGGRPAAMSFRTVDGRRERRDRKD